MKTPENIFNSKIEELLRGDSRKAIIDKMLQKPGRAINYYIDLDDYCEFELKYKIVNDVQSKVYYNAIEMENGDQLSVIEGVGLEEFYEYKAKKLLYKMFEKV